jgi:hypothetical protein
MTDTLLENVTAAVDRANTALTAIEGWLGSVPDLQVTIQTEIANALAEAPLSGELGTSEAETNPQGAGKVHGTGRRPRSPLEAGLAQITQHLNESKAELNTVAQDGKQQLEQKTAEDIRRIANEAQNALNRIASAATGGVGIDTNPNINNAERRTIRTRTYDL